MPKSRPKNQNGERLTPFNGNVFHPSSPMAVVVSSNTTENGKRNGVCGIAWIRHSKVLKQEGLNFLC